MDDDKKRREGPFRSFKSRKLFCGRQSWAPGESYAHNMIVTKKVVETTEGSPSDKTSHSVVKKTVEKTDGVRTITRTVMNCPEHGIDEALRKLDIDPTKFHSGGTSVTKTIVYRDSSGKQEVVEETVETYGDPDKIAKEAGQRPDIFKEFKHTAKTDAQKMGSSFTKAPSTTQQTTTYTTKVPSTTQQTKSDKKVSAPSAGPMSLGKFQDECLKAHNEYRVKHGVPTLVLSKELCAYSQEWADHLAATERFEHRTQGRKYGENIYNKWSSDPNHSITGKVPVDSWYSEIKDHVFGKEPTSMKSGHFTQVVWKSSKQLGCGFARSKSGKLFVVANYDPPGNFVGSYTANVPPPKR